MLEIIHLDMYGSRHLQMNLTLSIQFNHLENSSNLLNHQNSRDMQLRFISKNIIKVISKEIIKPCSPTPRHLRSYKFSLLDQLVPDIYFSFVFFYPSSSSSSSRVDHNSIGLLKNSLSKTLTHYYPLAGRVRDNFSVDCDDSGVEFSEAHANCNMSQVLENPVMDVLEQLLPFNPYNSLDVIFSVQLNHFDCGGMAIACNCRHIVADASSGIWFFNNWARIASGSGNPSDEIKDVVVDSTSIFPPDDKISSYSARINEWQRSTECVTKRFTFDGDKISALKKEITGDDDESDKAYRPSRFVSLCALIWDALIDMDRSDGSSNNGSTTTALASIPVNLRGRLNPPLPEDCMGNLIHSGTCFAAESEGGGGGGGVGCKSLLARKIKKYTKTVNDEFVRELYGGGVFANLYMEAVEEVLKKGNNVKLYGFSGPIGMPYYEVDFGWGKPIWFSTVMRLNNTVALLDKRDGKGIEAWVGLPYNDMLKFEQHPGILNYASFTPLPQEQQDFESRCSHSLKD